MMVRPDDLTMKSTTNGLWHVYWQPSQWIHTTISCQHSFSSGFILPVCLCIGKAGELRVADTTDSARRASGWKVITKAVTYQGGISISAANSLHGKGVCLFHGNSESGHFGALKTMELVSRGCYWPAVDLHICQDVSGCPVYP